MNVNIDEYNLINKHFSDV